MKILSWFALFGLGSAFADFTAPPRAHVSAETVLASIPASPVPSEPRLIHVSSPDRAVILHGDLFGDGRHLALVGSDNTALAINTGGGWRILQTEEVCPAWLSPGKTSIDEGYNRSTPSANPFTLTDLDGDKTPELLVDTDHGNVHMGCSIASKGGQGLRFLEVVSIRKHPRIKEGLMQVVTETSGSKAWWDVDTYFRWKNGSPMPVARWAEDSRDPEKWSWLAERLPADGASTSYLIRQNPANGNESLVSRCTWKHGVETENEQAFAKLTFTENDKAVENMEKIEAVTFEILTGLPAEAFQSGRDTESIDLDGVRVQVDGSDEAKKTLKRIGPQTRK